MQKNNPKKIILLGAGGREFHNFNVCFRENPNYEVVAFTAAQIPNIENRIYPPELAGVLYHKGIPIFPEEKLTDLIKKYNVNEVIFAYSDVSHSHVMHTASRVLASGANFRLLGPKETQLQARIPVVAVCAVRTGCGKSAVSRKIAKILKKYGKKPVIVRHPMPYGNLKKQIIQRFENVKDLNKAQCTIEEREEYEPLIREGLVVFAGVDYEKILNQAQKEAEIIIWDGGNNDLPFFKPDLHIVVTDPCRPGDEICYHPGETNLRIADVIMINKIDVAKKKDIAKVYQNIKIMNPRAKIIYTKSKVFIDNFRLIKNKRVLVIEDGPTTTHGEMPYGVGMVAAKKYKAKSIVAPKPWAKGTIKEIFKKYPHIKKVLPALGYGSKQIKDLQLTINAVPCDTIVSATPIDISQILTVNKPIVNVFYEIQEIGKLTLTKILKDAKMVRIKK